MSAQENTMHAAIDLPLNQGGTIFIEASAGTGKTYTLTSLVARLVVERHLAIDQILAVTFTRAAAAELRNKIRTTLGSVLAHVEAALRQDAKAPDEDPQALELIDAWKNAGDIDFGRARRRLEDAMLDIDRASVFTIHGFCQRVLTDLAFESTLPFGFEMTGDAGELVDEATWDAWRRHFYSADNAVVHHVLKNKFLPGQLGQWIAAWRAKTNVLVRCGGPPENEIDEGHGACEDAWNRVRFLWDDHGLDFEQEIIHGEWLNRNRYRVPKAQEEVAQLGALILRGDLPLADRDLLHRYGRTELESACKKDLELPENPLFEAFDLAAQKLTTFCADLDQLLRMVRKQTLTEVRESIRRHIREHRTLSFDDLLIELDAALGGPGKEHLAARIRRDYPCALIDEYQDTDPAQARIFDRIYREAPRNAGGAAADPARESGDFKPLRIVVGDPKQSIYRFRGADVYAYLQARRQARERLTLGYNWRSAPPLVDAVNTIFQGAAPFATKEIEYRPVQAADIDRDRLRVKGDRDLAPFRFRLYPKESGGKKAPAKSFMETIVPGHAAGEIAHLLSRARDGKATIGDRPVTGADIAVLVRTRREGRFIADALRARRIRCVEISIDSVFETREAEQLERLLWALAEPGLDAYAKGALGGDLLGLDARQLRGLGDDDGAWNEWSALLAEWRAHWHARGIGSLIHHVLEARGGTGFLLGLDGGLRKLTNVRHLADILQEQESGRRLTPPELATWFGHRRAQTIRKDEAHELRLESDEDLVKIMTIHASKGLEFPIVFCPFAWSASKPTKGDDASYHLGRGSDYRAVVTLKPENKEHDTAHLEEFSEELRLLYVALTRAKYRCVVAWGQVNQSEHAPLAWLLHRDDKFRKHKPLGPAGSVKALKQTRTRYLGLDPEQWRGDVEALAKRHRGAISFTTPEPLPEELEAYDVDDDASSKLAPRTFGRPLKRIRQMTSFSALSTYAHVGVVAGAPTTDADLPDYGKIEAPDHDQAEPPADEDAAPSVIQTAARTAFTFPRGPTPGSCLHWIFERLDDPQAEPPELDILCRRALSRFGFGSEWQSVVRDMVRRTRAVRLLAPMSAPGDEGFRLDGDVPKLVELEFAFPISDLRKERLGALLAEHGYPNPFEKSLGDDGDDAFGAINGFLRGFIDLIVENQGRWYVVDYKSNWLGPGLENYGPEALNEAIRKGNYALQFLLYVVAFDRYLRSRLADYRYEQHFGGVFYLFTRGIDPDAGMSRGVYFNRPSEQCIRVLDAYFREA